MPTTGTTSSCAGLSAIAAAIPPDPAFERVRASAEGAANIVREDVDALRGTLTEMYPPDLGGSRLVPVVAALLKTAAGEGIRTQLDAPGDLHLPVEAAVLVHRVVREGLRNVRKHANATSVTVRLASLHGAVTVEIVDDGIGMRPEPAPGHLGSTAARRHRRGRRRRAAGDLGARRGRAPRGDGAAAVSRGR